ncbi:SDR family NAD(P)-dependent oxidoreductase [Novosphingobium sp. TH158]|uniref:SDR family NAD(P)-dependent oxidoreductase n=1 Tax=Novosphingobium sp. TH158 TaxID=2067455 RepID=UPI000C7BAC41|nr:glucose 1-dehydrogenase [Novosphingobium sp. TH158]PLK26955.1 oxidoreductase [Novosphingobium sp. TH158]
MQGLLDGRNVIVTGAGSGVGRAACLLFARHGAKVMALDIGLEAAQATADMVSAEGGTALARACDVGDAAAVDAAVAATVEAFGWLDVIYNNAGITLQPRAGYQGVRKFIDTDDDEIERIYRVNVNGVINGCKAAIRQFEAQAREGRPGGVIVNTASVAGLIGWGGSAYGSSKGAVTLLTKTLALELAAQGIRVNSVCPAGMPTNFLPGLQTSDAAKASMGATHPLGRPIDPMDCANAALFLASDLSSNITGVNLPVDGGLSAGIPPRR